MRSHRSKRVRGTTLVLSMACTLLALGALGCTSTSPDMYDADGNSLMRLSPAPMRIAVAPVEMDGFKRSDSELQLALRSSKELQDALVAALREVGAAAEIVAVNEAPMPGRMSEDDDYVIRPRLRSAEFAYSGTANGAPLAAVLWFVTWFGGLLIDDCTYTSQITMEFEVFDPKLDDQAMSPLSLTTTETSLSFFERNDAFNKGFWQSLLIPPFWTSDNAEETSASITDEAMLQMAAKLKGFMCTSLSGALADNRFVEVEFTQPRAGARLRGPIEVRAEIRTKVEVSDIFIQRNGVALKNSDYARMSDIPRGAAQGAAGRYVVPLALDGLKLVAGDNRLQFWITLTNGETVSRTIVVVSRDREDNR